MNKSLSIFIFFIYGSVPWLLNFPVVSCFFYGLILIFGLKQIANRWPTISNVKRQAVPQDVRLTVIIPIYNEAENLPALLENLTVNQHDDVSYLFIDDASTDNSAAIIRGQGFPVHTVPKQKYVCDVLNIGAILAPDTSNYIGVLNGDCLLAPDAMEKIMERLTWYHMDVLNMSNHVLPSPNAGVFFAHLEKKFKNALSIYSEASLTNGYFLRRTLLKEGWQSITEDLHMTLQLKAKGVKIHQDPDIIVYDNVPKAWNAFIRQKYRWIYGDVMNRIVVPPRNLFDLIVNIYYFFPVYSLLSFLPGVATADVWNIQCGIILLEITLYIYYIENIFEALLYGHFQFFFQVYFYLKLFKNWKNNENIKW